MSEPEPEGAGPMEEDAPEPTSGGDQLAAATAARLAREASQLHRIRFLCHLLRPGHPGLPPRAACRGEG